MVSFGLGWLWILLAKEWRERYPRAAAAVGELFGVALTLAVYWYTSRAIEGGGALRELRWPGSYFSYLVLNEATLVLPLAALQALPNWLREARASGVLEAVLTLPGSRAGNTLRFAAPALLEGAVRASVFFAVAVAVGGLPSGVAEIATWTGAVVLAVPIFLGLGLLAGGFWLATQRGLGILPILVAAGAVLGGAYFPKDLLPEGVRAVFDFLSPLTWLLELARGVFLAEASARWGGALLVGGVLALPLGVIAFHVGVARARARGSVEILA
jgi:ABC-type multidrug transport system permease subunit